MEVSNVDTWVTIPSSDDEAYDSDKIDSDIEAELYSVIHHEADTTKCPGNESGCKEPNMNTSSSVFTENLPARKDSQINNSTTNSPKTDTLDLSDTDLYTSFETPQKKQLQNDSSSDEIEIIEELSNYKKRKSDVLDDSVEVLPLDRASNKNVKSSQKKQRTQNLNRSSNNQSINNRTIEIDTSDSDSIVWSEAGDSNVKLQTNLDDGTIVELDSCSFSSEDSFSPFLSNKSFSGTYPADASQPSTSSFNENSKDPWFIISEDLYRSKKSSSRYHERAVLQCTNCNLKGHSAKFCSVPKVVKCFICGGAHMATKCKDKVCHKCLQTGHDSRYCGQRLFSVCVHCNMKGHSAKNCPDLWRRYHLTTNQSNIIVGNPIAQTTPIYCYSCGDKGHYGAQCQAPRNDRFSFPTWTSVISYLHPNESLQRASAIQRNTQLGGAPVWLPNFNQASPNFNQTPPNFNRLPPANFNQQSPNFKQAPPNFNRLPPANFNQQSPNFKQAPPNFNRIPPANFNQQPPNFDQMPPNFNRLPPANFNQTASQRQLTRMANIKAQKINERKKRWLKNQKAKQGNNSQQTEISTRKKKKSQTEVYFPRTPKQETPETSKQLTPAQKKKLKRIKKLQKKQQKQDNAFLPGLHKRLGLL